MIDILIVNQDLNFARSLEAKLERENDLVSHGSLVRLPPQQYFYESSDINVLIVSEHCATEFGPRVIYGLRQSFPDLKILLVTDSDHPVIEPAQFLKGPYHGVIEKSAALNEFQLAIRLLHYKRGGFISHRIGKNCFAKGRIEPIIDTRLPLSKREIEIIQLIYEEYSSEEIAHKLGISLHTVNNHRKNISTKLNLKNVVSLAKYARDHKLVDY